MLVFAEYFSREYYDHQEEHRGEYPLKYPGRKEAAVAVNRICSKRACVGTRSLIFVLILIGVIRVRSLIRVCCGRIVRILIVISSIGRSRVGVSIVRSLVPIRIPDRSRVLIAVKITNRSIAIVYIVSTCTRYLWRQKQPKAQNNRY